MFVPVGLGLLWRARQRSEVPRVGRSLLGLLLAGWGIFNLVEGIIDHHLLGIHHVRPGPNQLLFDLGFLVLGVVLFAVGLVLYRSGTTRPVRQGTTSRR
jgi:uncharacterized membrane protein